MTLRGKDYCNCDHAQMLRKALEDVVSAESPLDAYTTAQAALDEDHEACIDLWGDIKTARECERIIK